MSVLEAMMTLGEYFNKGPGKEADQETRDAWNAMRDFVMLTFHDALEMKWEKL